MHRLLILIPFFLIAGCLAISPEDRATVTAMQLHRNDTPLIRYSEINGRKVMLARDGAALIDRASRIEIAQMLKYRNKNQKWPEIKEITTEHESWKVSIFEDYLFIDRLSGDKSLLSQSYISPDAYFSADEKLLPFLTKLDIIAKSAERKSSAPPIITP